MYHKQNKNMINHISEKVPERTTSQKQRPHRPVLHVGLDDFGVYLGNSVDDMGAHDAEVGHVDPLAAVLLDQGHPAETVRVSWKECCDVLQTRQEMTFLIRGGPGSVEELLSAIRRTVMFLCPYIPVVL